MVKFIYVVLRRALYYFILATLIMVMLPFVGGFISSATTCGGVTEQHGLDRIIDHLTWLREDCKDPQLQDILDYTITRYNHIGPFDVAVRQCNGWTLLPKTNYILGENNPLCPGVTLDLTLFTECTLHTAAMVLVHEALHDYPPYLGHSYVTPMINKLEDYYVQRTTNR